MKHLIYALSALVSLSAFADTANLETDGSKQTLTIEGRRIPGPRRNDATLAQELMNIGMNAPDTYSKDTDSNRATSFEGKFMSGSITHRVGASTFKIVIEQRIVKSRRQMITEGEGQIFNVFGDAAEEIYKAGIEAGYEVNEPAPGSKSPNHWIRGESFTCSESPLGGLNYRCQFEVR